MRHMQPWKEGGGRRVVRAVSCFGSWGLHRFQAVSPAVLPAFEFHDFLIHSSSWLFKCLSGSCQRER